MRLFNCLPLRDWSGTLVLSLCVILLALPAKAQDDVSISKARLQELERKEAELEKLRNQLNAEKPAPAPAVPPSSVKGTNTTGVGLAPAPASVPPAAPTPASPASATLPPLGADEVVSAIDLAAQYEQDRAAADKRYRKKSFSVQGEIERFEKRLFGRSYSILMKTGGSKLRVVCEVYPPEPYTVVFTASHDSEIVGMFGENRQVLAKADSIAIAQGECKGLDGATITIKGCALKSVRSAQK